MWNIVFPLEDLIFRLKCVYVYQAIRLIFILLDVWLAGVFMKKISGSEWLKRVTWLCMPLMFQFYVAHENPMYSQGFLFPWTILFTFLYLNFLIDL